MQSKGEAVEALNQLIRDVVIPEQLHTDGAKEMTLGNWKKICNEYRIKMSNAKKSSPWQNCTETENREFKKHMRMHTHANAKERVYTTAGSEFGTELQGKCILIIKDIWLEIKWCCMESALSKTFERKSISFMLSQPGCMVSSHEESR